MAVRCLEAASQRAVCDPTVQTEDCTCMWYGVQSGFGLVLYIGLKEEFVPLPLSQGGECAVVGRPCMHTYIPVCPCKI